MKNITLLLCCLTLACSLHKVDETIEAPQFTPPAFSQSGSSALSGTWWTALEDPVLDGLIDQALTGNLDLEAARSRLDQFRALEMRRNQMPVIAVDAGLGRGRSNFGNQTVTESVYSMNAGVSWEVDLWKRLESIDRAEALDSAAVRSDMEAFALTLSASVARTLYGIVAGREQLNLLEEQAETNRKLLEVIEVRFENAQGSAVDVFQQREQLASIRAAIPPVRSRVEVLEHQLAVLLGRSPTEALAAKGNVLPQLPDMPDAGLPVALLQNRPDIRAAAFRVNSADYRLGAAIAARYPTLRLSGSTGSSASSVGDLFSNWIWNLFGGLAAPVFDQKSLESEELRNRAVLKEVTTRYEQTVLLALQEVEDALAREKHRRDYIARLREQETLAQAALDSGQTRYLEGVGNFLTVLTELQALQRVQRTIVDARLLMIQDRIDLYQALGGDWTAHLAKATSTTGGKSQ